MTTAVGPITERWDVVVVGSGLGGLTAAACLATAGRRVLVVERHDVAGGNATVFRRHHLGDEYEFDVGVHYIGECQPGGLLPTILDSVGVGDRVTFRQLDPDGFDTIVLPGREIRIPAGWDRYVDAVTAALPRERTGIEECLGTLRAVARQSRERLIPGTDTPEHDLGAYQSLSALFDHCGLSSTARTVLDHWAGLYAGPPSRTAVITHATIADHYMHGAFYPTVAAR